MLHRKVLHPYLLVLVQPTRPKARKRYYLSPYTKKKGFLDLLQLFQNQEHFLPEHVRALTTTSFVVDRLRALLVPAAAPAPRRDSGCFIPFRSASGKSNPDRERAPPTDTGYLPALVARALRRAPRATQRPASGDRKQSG